MIVFDYLPLILTFLLAVLGLLLKTARDPDGESLKRRLTKGGIAVLLLLLVSLALGIGSTIKRKRTDHASSQQAKARYAHDSTVAAANLEVAHTELLVQHGAIVESRLAAGAQLRRLDSTLTVSRFLARDLRSLQDSLREQTSALSREMENQRQALQREAARLRNPIASPQVRLLFNFPPIDQAKALALRALSSPDLDLAVHAYAPNLNLNDSVRARMRTAITDSRYGHESLLFLSQEDPYVFPTTFLIRIWTSPEGHCADEIWDRNPPYISIRVSTPKERWQNYGEEDNGPVYNVYRADAEIDNSGMLSLLDLNQTCFTVRGGFQNEPTGDLMLLHEAIWYTSALRVMELDFGGGRVIRWYSHGPGGVKLPVFGRLYIPTTMQPR